MGRRGRLIIALLGAGLTFGIAAESMAESAACKQARGDYDRLSSQSRNAHEARLQVRRELTLLDTRNTWDEMWLISCAPVLQDLTPSNLTPAEVSQCARLAKAIEESRNRRSELYPEYVALSRRLDGFIRQQEELYPIIRECDRIAADGGGHGNVEGCQQLTAAAVTGGWNWFGGKTTLVTLSGNGAVVSRHKDGRQLNEGTWFCQNNGIVIEWQRRGSEFVDTLRIEEGGKKLSGVNQFGAPVWGTR